MSNKNLQLHLRELNSVLTTIEENIMKTAIRLDTHLQQELSDSLESIIDYELEATIECYVGDDLLCTLTEYLKGCSTNSRYKIWRLADGNNHNEFEHRENHHMKDDQHCWLFHCLYDHVHMSWEEIASIQNFWVDIKPRYQYCIDIPSTDFTPSNKHLIFSDKYQFGMTDIVRNFFPDFFDTYPLDLRKFEKIGQHFHENIADIHFKPMSDEELAIFHTVDYLQSLREDKNIIEGVVAFSVPPFITVSMLNKHLVDSARAMTTGTVYAAEIALKTGWAINIGGGFHHARADSGGGFCFFNDYAIATHRLRHINPDLKILYVDLDAHFGDGVLAFASETDNFYILDLYNAFRDLREDYFIRTDVEKRFIHIGLQAYTSDNIYLGLLQKHLPSLINDIKPDMIFYNAGSDILKGDPLGYLSVSPQGLLERDLYVFNEAKQRSIPIMMCLSGGYGKKNYQYVIKSLEAIITLMSD